MQHKRVIFQGRALPYMLVLPQLVITLVFFIWPASQALYQSVLLEDQFGLSSQFVWFENFEDLFADPASRDRLPHLLVQEHADHLAASRVGQQPAGLALDAGVFA